jgi:cysteine desulfurase/selenocysteine lyase
MVLFLHYSYLMINIDKIRSDFPILETRVYGHPLVYLDNAATTQKPRDVLERVSSFYREENANIHRGSHFLSEKASSAYESARDCVRKFINARKSSEIIFTSGTTFSINLVAQSFGTLRVNRGDEIIVTEMEHHSNLIPWQILCENKGAFLKVVPFDNNGSLQIDLLKSLISEKTKLIAFTYVSNVLGTINPVKEITSLAHSFNVPVLIDGAQAVQHLPIDVQEIDCDFFVFSGHKIYAETGIGVLYGKESLLERMPPYQTGGGMVSSVDFSKVSFNGLPFKFEAGTGNIAGAVSLEAAINYMNKIGLDNINLHEQELFSFAEKELSAIEGLEIYGKSPQRCTLISFNIGSTSPYDACAIMDKMGIALRSGTHCSELTLRHFGIRGSIRASFALYNTKNEIELLVRGIRKVKSMIDSD